MKRSELQEGVEYALNTWGGNVRLGDSYGVAKAVVISTAQVERQTSVFAQSRKAHDGVQVRIVGDQTSEGYKARRTPDETVVSTRKIIGTWEQHEQSRRDRAEAERERQRRERAAARRTKEAVAKIEVLVPEEQRRLIPWGIKESGRSYGNIAATDLAALLEFAYEQGKRDERAKIREPHCSSGNPLSLHTGPCDPGCEYPDPAKDTLSRNS